jgi:phage tail sheath protein FI
MPVTPTYPGVYIQERSSGVRTITGVATSITAFVGRALRGPTDEPTVVNSWSDFERAFGGLWTQSAMSYAVRDFYLNGGSTAIVVRVFRDVAGPTPKPGPAKLATSTANPLKLIAANPGAWGNNLRVRIDDKSGDPTTLFNLTVRDLRPDGTSALEVFRNLSVADDHPRNAARVLLNESQLIRADGALPAALPVAHAAPAPGDDIWAAHTPATSDGVAGADDVSDGQVLQAAQFTADTTKGLYALDRADLFNLLNIPPYTAGGGVDTAVLTSAGSYCESRRAFLIVDPPWTTKATAVTGAANFGASLGTTSRNAAVFFPRLLKPNPLHDNQIEPLAPGGAVAGIFARTDAQRGVWKAPAGLDASLAGVPALEVPLTDPENGELNPLGVNCLRVLPSAGAVVWGARTLRGADRLADDWKYTPVRRTALFIEESLYRGTQWVVFEPNADPLWAQIRLSVGSFMHDLFRQDAFAGVTPREAYFVKCDGESTTPSDVNRGVVNILVGFAPLKPAEFVIITLQQMAGQLTV